MELDENYYFTNDKLEFYNMTSFMKAGLYMLMLLVQ